MRGDAGGVSHQTVVMKIRAVRGIVGTTYILASDE